MPKSKRSGRRVENIIASRAMQHHDFVGGADAAREASEKQKEARIQHDHAALENEVVREMARELETEAGVRKASPAEQPPAAERRPAAGQHPAAAQGLIGRGIELLEEARDNAPRALETLRAKAEERLAALPRPVKRAIHRGEQAAALLLAPARIGVALARELLKAPGRLFEAFRRQAV